MRFLTLSLFAVLMLCACVLPEALRAQDRTEAKIIELTGTPWQLPTVTLLDGRLRVWSMDTLWLKNIEHISLYVAGEEFVAKEFDFQPWLRWRTSTEREGNVIRILSSRMAPVQSFPLHLWCLPDPYGEDTRLSNHATPDSLFMTGSFEDGAWFFQFMELGANGEFKRRKFFIETPGGMHWSDPPGMTDPRTTYLLPSTRDI